jgi:hypothetical protein
MTNPPLLSRALGAALLLCGCDRTIDGYLPASAISSDGFARGAETARGLQGQEVRLWGFVDHANLYGDAGTREILGELWGGAGPSGTSWRFDLLARADDPAGHSFQVHCPNDPGRDALLRRFVEDARAGRPTRVFVSGTMRSFAAPTNLGRRIGLSMETPSSLAIRPERPRP